MQIDILPPGKQMKYQATISTLNARLNQLKKTPALLLESAFHSWPYVQGSSFALANSPKPIIAS